MVLINILVFYQTGMVLVMVFNQTRAFSMESQSKLLCAPNL